MEKIKDPNVFACVIDTAIVAAFTALAMSIDKDVMLEFINESQKRLLKQGFDDDTVEEALKPIRSIHESMEDKK